MVLGDFMSSSGYVKVAMTRLHSDNPMGRLTRLQIRASSIMLVSLLFTGLAGFACAAEQYETAGGRITVTPQVHASVQLEFNGLVIQADPWGIGGLENFKAADIILVTDNSPHHLDAAAIDALSKPTTTVIMAANGQAQLPHGIVLNNGQRIQVQGVAIQSIAAYDIIPGAPEHPRGEANGYLLQLGGSQVYLAGVTECVEEIRALDAIDIAILPMNIPPVRMPPADVASCAREIGARNLYIYHYDQNWARQAVRPGASALSLPGDMTVDETVRALASELTGTGITFRDGDWYPVLD